MRRAVLIACCILILMQFSGCLRGIYSTDSPRSISALPELIVDYELERNATKFWVKSPITDYRYDSIRITITNETQTRQRAENYTYCIDLEAPFRHFTINASATSKDVRYEFQCDCEIRYQQGLTFQFVYMDRLTEKTEQVLFEDLPWKITLRIMEQKSPLLGSALP